jgi:hypothetical protein
MKQQGHLTGDLVRQNQGPLKKKEAEREKEKKERGQEVE